MADSGQQRLSYQEELSYATVDGSSAFTELKFTGGSFGESPDITRSNQVRSDGQRARSQRTNVTAQPSIDFEMQTSMFDDFLRGALRSGSFSTAVNISASDITADNTASEFQSTSGGTDFTAENFDVGQFFRVSGFSTTDANGWFQVTSVSQNALGVEPAPADDTNSGSATITMAGSYIRNGTTDTSFALQLENLDLSSQIQLLKGCRVNTASMSITPGSLITGSFGFEGQRLTNPGTLSGDGTVTAASDNEVYNGVDNVQLIAIDGASTNIDITEFSISTTLNATRKEAIGTLGALDVNPHTIDVTGTLNMYLDDDSKSQIDNLINFTKQELTVAFDINGVGYAITLPRVAYTGEGNNLAALDEDKLLQFDFAAEPGDATANDFQKTIQVTRAT